MAAWEMNRMFDYRLLPGVRDVKGEELAVLVGVAKITDVRARIDQAKQALAAEPELLRPQWHQQDQ